MARQCFLSMSVWYQDTRCLSIMIGSRFHQNRMHFVAVGYGFVEALQDKNTETLASSISLTTIVKRIASPIRIGELAELVVGSVHILFINIIRNSLHRYSRSLTT